MKLDDTPARALSADPAERLVDAIDLPIGRWAMSGDEARLLFCNVPYTRWACRPSADLVGRTLTELYGPAAWAAAKDAFAVAFTGKAAGSAVRQNAATGQERQSGTPGRQRVWPSSMRAELKARG